MYTVFTFRFVTGVRDPTKIVTSNMIDAFDMPIVVRKVFSTFCN